MRQHFDPNNLRQEAYLFLSKDPSASRKYLTKLSLLFDIKMFSDFGNNSHRSVFEEQIVKAQSGHETIFYSTMNPDIINLFYFADVKEIQRRIVLVNDDGEDAELLDYDEADNLFRAYEVGVQNFREILWQKGIW